MTDDTSRRGATAPGRRKRKSATPRGPASREPRAADAPGLFASLPPLLAERPTYLLWRLALRWRQLLDSALEPLGIRARTFGLLALLAHVGPISQQALSDFAGVDASTMVAIVDGLEDLGVAKRRRDPRDRRAYLLQLTESGERMLEAAHELAADVDRQLLAPLDPADQTSFLDLLKTLVTATP